LVFLPSPNKFDENFDLSTIVKKESFNLSFNYSSIGDPRVSVYCGVTGGGIMILRISLKKGRGKGNEKAHLPKTTSR